MATVPSLDQPGSPSTYPIGQRLHCATCGAEVEIVNPCPCNPPDQVIRCCGRDMTPTIGRDIHLGDD